MENWFQKYVDLSEAVRDLYYAAYWSADRQVDEKRLWETVRDTAGLQQGKSFDVLGPKRT